ncbi:hypothetical protein U879_08515 [Defluviimonas sp. 20V17]|uniref:CopC domain-containing protein n=1 Tax=Allgaiera indica TaxID=765699 RepID=A0AAN4UNA2_9RHOB|nr:copper resistance CopC family protein [Allgaiera indica]KDB04088.1 hypothetical protein U879_08515 [Defluviimonas sp. 20V17]GHD98518.1 hypothetical protein GCM10008024_02350 [Allgaiera indica]SDW11993.1 hypothetical protein SAMN05444006_101312 [Allgaiera indica]
MITIRLPHTATTVFAAAFALGISLAAGNAFAHGSGMQSMPADGQTVAAGTKVMHLMFDAPMRVTKVTMTAPEGKTYKINGPAANQAVKVWEGKLPKLARGKYKVDWRGMSPDGHPMKGDFAFTVGQ